jgi:DNA-binding response OmpR family regulator
MTADVDTHRGTVLVVDDEPDLSWVMRFNLEVEGFRTYSAADGKAALHLIDQHRPEVMILDVMMPVMDGWSVLEELGKGDLPRPRVVVVSARTSPEDRARAARLGVDAFIPKPFELEDLIEVVRSLLPSSQDGAA